VLFPLKTLRSILAIAGLFGFAGCSFLITVPDLSDGKGHPDAAVDHQNPSAVDAGDAGLCDGLPHSAFCDDFDHAPLSDVWDRHYGDVGADTSFAESPPKSFFAKIPASETSGCFYAQAEKDVVGSFTGTRLTFSFRAGGEASLSNESIAVQRLGVEGGDGACVMIVGLEWNGSDYNLTLSEQVLHGSIVDNEFHSARSVPANTWQRITVDVDYTANKVTVVEPSGLQRLDEPLKLNCAYFPNQAGVTVGFSCSSKKTSDREIRIDDVVFEPR
jgi:hypothetical protein